MPADVLVVAGRMLLDALLRLHIDALILMRIGMGAHTIRRRIGLVLYFPQLRFHLHTAFQAADARSPAGDLVAVALRNPPESL